MSEDEARRLAEGWAEEYGDESISLPLFFAAKIAPILAERDEARREASAEHAIALAGTARQRQQIADLEATLRDLTNLKSADVQRIAELEAEIAEAIAELSEMYTDTTPQEYAGDQPIPHSPTLSESVMAVKAEVERWKPKDEHGDPWTPDSYIAALEAEVAERVETPAYTQIAEERDELKAEVERFRSADRIYLQDGDGEIDVTWCEDRINNSDSVWVRLPEGEK